MMLLYALVVVVHGGGIVAGVTVIGSSNSNCQLLVTIPLDLY